MSHDVRMRGFSRRHALDEALTLLLSRVRALPEERVPLSRAAGRVLSRPVVSEVDLPAFPKSAVDGYAVRAEDTFGANDFHPATLRQVGESLPGRPYASKLEPGEAVRIMTGAPVPDGADAVVMAEYAREDSGSPRRVHLSAAVPPGRNVCPVGEDVRRGATVLTAGRRLRPEDLGLLAALRIGAATVHRAPRVRIFTCGAELIDPDSAGVPAPETAAIDPDPAAGSAAFSTVDCNTLMLEALVRQAGGLPDRRGIVPEDPETLRALFLEGDADVILSSGATSVGAEDLLPPLVRALGELWVHGVSIKPGAPVGIGRVGERLVFLLPGNPVATLVTFELLVRPVLQVLQGLPPGRLDRPVRARLTRKIASSPGRVDFVRTTLKDEATGSAKSRLEATPIGSGGAGILTTMTRADGFFLVPAELEGLEAGDEVEVYLL